MLTGETGPVLMAETSRVLACLRALSDRAESHGQQALHFVLSITADSLADNLETAADMAGSDE
ncbi:hypothetical protein [Rhodanobacter soli]|uniref:Uncharacterized protein n=1 Tax=Rhodanobacter soli TaxID=590609 RepID=A0ABV2PT09_9GAMM